MLDPIANLKAPLPRAVKCAVIALLIATLVTPPSARADLIIDPTGVLTGDNLFFNVTYSGTDINTIAAGSNVDLAGPNQLVNLNPAAHDALADSLTQNFGYLQTGNTGHDFQITLSQPFTNYGQLSAGAHLIVGDFTNLGALEVRGGGVNTLTVGGNFSNMQADGTLLGGNYYIDSDGTLEYTGSDIKALGPGTTLTLANTGDTVTGRVLNLAGESPDAVLNSLTDNYGQFSVQQNAVATLNTNFTNHDGGTLQAALNGQLTLGGAFTNIDGSGLLSGGNYIVGLGSSLIYAGADIQTLGSNTSLTFDNFGGATTGQFVNATGQNHDAVSDSLMDNLGSLAAFNGAQLTLTRNFTNEGNVYVDTDGHMTFNGGFSNVQGGTLTGGSYVLGTASSLIYNGADIQAIGANTNVTFDNSNGPVTGQFLNLAGLSHNAISGSLTDNSGSLSLNNGAALTLSQSFTNHDGATVSVNSGTFTTAGLDNQVGASISIAGDGSTLHSTGAARNAGTISFDGTNGTVSSDGDFTNSADSLTVAGEGNVLATKGSLINTGGLIIGAGGKVTAQTGVQQTGALDIQAGGELDLGKEATFTQTAGNTTVDGTLDPATIDIFGGTVDGTGSLWGNVVVAQAGVVKPGDDGTAGTLTVNGNYTQTAGELDILLGDYGQGTGYSFLDVTGTASLGGYLNLSSFGDFNLLAGDTFTVFQASSLNGTFSSSSWSNLTQGLTYSLLYGNNNVEVVVSAINTSAPEPGTFVLFGGIIALAGLWRRQHRSRA